MSFDEILRELTCKTGATGAVIIAGDGEAVSSWSASAGTQMEIIGAQHAALFNMIKEASKGRSGKPRSVVITTRGSRIVITSLKEGYFLLVAAGKNRPAGLVISESASAAGKIEEEMG